MLFVYCHLGSLQMEIHTSQTKTRKYLILIFIINCFNCNIFKIYSKMQLSQQQNIEPNNSPQLIDLIRDNMEYQQNQNIKSILYKESLVKISLDKDFYHLFEDKDKDNSKLGDEKESVQQLVEVTNQIKDVCNWLEQSQDFKGMAYIPYNNLTKLMHILHQKVEGTVIIVTDYHSVWMQKMEEMARLYKIKWAFLNPHLQKEDKIKVLELYEMKKIKLFFISPSIFKLEQYLDFHCDLLVIPDLHLYLRSQQFFNKIVDKCNPGRLLALYSTLMSQTYIRSDLNIAPINTPNPQPNTLISLKTHPEQKFKSLLAYLQKTQSKRTLLLIRDKSQSLSLSKQLKLKSMTSFNIFDYLTIQEMDYFNSPQILSRNVQIQDKVMEVVYKSRNYQITISKYFDALRFGSYQCVVFYNFVDVPKFVEFCFDVQHRLTMLCEEDYFKLRNQITSQHITTEMLTKIVMRIMERPKKRQNNSNRRFFSDSIDDRLLQMYSVSKNYIQKNEEKVIRINWFCKTYDISQSSFKKVINGLCKNQIVTKDCKLVYQIQIEQESLSKFRKLFPQTIEVRRKVNLLNLSTAVQKTTRVLLEQLKKQSIGFKVTQKAIQLKIIKNYEEVDWNELQTTVNKSVTDSALDLDKSYQLFKQCSYGSVELTRRQKYLQRKKEILNFYSYELDKQSNIFQSSHRSNLLTSQIQQWIRHSNENLLDQHDLILLLQGIENQKTSKSKQDPIFGRYRKFKYEDLSQVVQRIYKQKRIKR